MTPPRQCWVCDAADPVLARPSTVATMAPEDFAISDAHYGRTAAIYRCRGCGFLQCADIGDVIGFYQALEDPDYIESRPERLLQARRLLRDIERLSGRPLHGLRLLDVGAGSGPLVEEALRLGVRAEGVEPSQWLHDRARAAGLPVHHGTLPHADAPGPYDVVALIDVIEHTTDPLGLLRTASALLAPGGLLVLVTPDVSSTAARLLGWRWWHFRLAHVGYFSPDTLRRAIDRVGLRPGNWRRAGWVLPLSYLLERAGFYLPFTPPRPAWTTTVAVPFNLRDSILMVAHR